MFRKVCCTGIALAVLISGLLLQPATPLFAQDDDNGMYTGGPSEPPPAKPESLPPDLPDEKTVPQADFQLFIPQVGSIGSPGPAVQGEAAWSVIMTEGFESSFPPATNSRWVIVDVNGSSVPAPQPNTTYVWDDTSTKVKTGYWSAHPNDSNVYANLTDTTMRFGPFTLLSATDARFSFWYFLDTEMYYDYFSYEFSCNLKNWTSWARSGTTNNVWVKQTVSLKPCVGQKSVYIRFSFRSDYSGTKPGVWVDDIRIEKYQ